MPTMDARRFVHPDRRKRAVAEAACDATRSTIDRPMRRPTVELQRFVSCSLFGDARARQRH
jgi:hypothetical protein